MFGDEREDAAHRPGGDIVMVARGPMQGSRLEQSGQAATGSSRDVAVTLNGIDMSGDLIEYEVTSTDDYLAGVSGKLAGGVKAGVDANNVGSFAGGSIGVTHRVGSSPGAAREQLGI